MVKSKERTGIILAKAQLAMHTWIAHFLVNNTNNNNERKKRRRRRKGRKTEMGGSLKNG
jgi:hypothetical protein